jgi:HAD superfamily hydrolase (TIGR01509 family)
MNTTRKILLLSTLTFAAFTAGYFTRNNNQNLKSQDHKRFKAIIFDMDGTTIDTDHLWKSSNGPILDSHAPHLTQAQKDEITCTFCTKTIYDVWKCVHGHCSVEISPEQIIEENMKHLLVAYKNQGISFIPHFHEFHNKVVTLGLKTAIASNSQQHVIDVIVDIVPLKDYFAEHIYNADHVNKVYKPAPDVYLHAAKMLDVQPCDCIAIEDSGSGIKAAKAAGMYCIGINTGKNRVALSQADEIVDCYTEIDLEKLLNLEI